MARLTGQPLDRELALQALGATRTYPVTSPPRWRFRSSADSTRSAGAWARSPKFPQPDVFGFMLAYGMLRGAGDPEHVPEGGSALLRPARVHEVVRATLTAMASGGMYDAVEGGFFRYATQRDWSVPHYEKMLEDNARLAWLYLEAALHAAEHDLGDPELYRRAGEGTVDYLLATLWRDDVPAFGGSQDADEDLLRSDAGERADLPRRSWIRPFTSTGTRWRRVPSSEGRRCSDGRSSPTALCSCSATCSRRRATATPWRTSCTRTARSATARRCWATRRPRRRRCSTRTRPRASGAGCAAR